MIAPRSRPGSGAAVELVHRDVEFSTLSQTTAEQREVFYRRMFPRRAEFLIEHWRWVYRVGYAAGIDPPVVVKGGLLIGQGGAIPVELAFRGTRRLALWYVDLALLPEFQGTGLGKRLTSVWMQLSPHQLGFNANAKSGVVLRRLGWQPCPWARRCALPLRPLQMAGSGPRIVVPLAATGGAVYRLALRAWMRGAADLVPASLPPDDAALAPLFRPLETASITIVRDASWLTWRIRDSPFVESYRLFRWREAAALVRGVVWDGQRRLHVLFVEQGPAVVRRELLRGIIKWALHHEVDVVWTVVNGRASLVELRSLLPSHAPVRFVAVSDDPAMLEAIRGPDFEMHGVDCDSDVMYVSDPHARFEW